MSAVQRILAVSAASFALASCDNPKPRAGDPPAIAAGAAAIPAWAVSLMDKELAVVFPKEGACKGNIDALDQFVERPEPGATLNGWAWNMAAGAPVDRIVFADDEGIIVGAGAGGFERPDVPKAIAEVTTPKVGWRGFATRQQGAVRAFGVVSEGTICNLGRLEL